MSNPENRSSIIKILPPEVSNKIAAGEVVQRPASVVKELMENAIDAGADHISLILQNAGRTLIRIRDNGCGMSEDDIRMCFMRHATSKLQHVTDLQNIRTLGFRGEAMASIASISQVTVTSKRVEDDNGVEYEIRGGEECRLEPAAADDGTTVTVRNLFYNVPARRAFLKTDATEFRHILLSVHQASLAHPEIAFDLEADGEIIYRLGSQDRESRISELFGKSYRASLITVTETTSLVRVNGLLSDPKLAKRTRGEQFLFINNRPFLHRHLSYIIQEIYKDWIQPGQYPFYALFYEVDPEMVDVNVHPSKQEIKFEDERTISAFTRSVVKKALNDHMRVPMWNLGGIAPHKDIRSFESGFSGNFAPATPAEELSNRKYDRESGNSFSRQLQRKRGVPGESMDKLYGPDPNAHLPKQYNNLEPTHPSAPRTASQTEVSGKSMDIAETDSGFWQIHRQFILSQTRNGMFIMDQHAAHKRIIYEKVLSEAESGLPSTQQLLFPITIDISATDFSLLKELHPIISRMGFNIQLLSGNSAMILGVPSDIRLDNEQQVLESIMDQYKRMSKSITLNEKERVALAIANRAAIPRGKKLRFEEMEALVDQLFACEQPFQDPLGNLTVRSLSVDELQALFR